VSKLPRRLYVAMLVVAAAGSLGGLPMMRQAEYFSLHFGYKYPDVFAIPFIWATSQGRGLSVFLILLYGFMIFRLPSWIEMVLLIFSAGIGRWLIEQFQIGFEELLFMGGSLLSEILLIGVLIIPAFALIKLVRWIYYLWRNKLCRIQ